jgi:hypothetical protein
MRRRRYLLIAFLGVLIAVGVGAGCLATAPRAVESSYLRGPFRVEVHRGGQPVSERPLAAGSAEEKAVADWLAAHGDGWSLSLVTYAPNRVVRGDGFNLNLLSDGRCVLNYDLSGSPRQVLRSVSPAEAEALVAAMGGE